MTKEDSVTTDDRDDAVVYDVGLRDQPRRPEPPCARRDTHAKEKEGMLLLVLSAFLFSFMGLFLQFTGRMGLPSTELVFIRSVFQGTFVVVGMFVFRVDESPSAAAESNDVETAGELAGGLVPIYEEPLDEKTHPETDTGAAGEKTSLQATPPGYAYDALVTTAPPQSFTPSPKALPPYVWQRPLGTTPAMRRIVVLRGVIGGFGFLNYYYTLSTLPLGDATTLLSLYPIVTIFVARCALGEAIRPLNLGAALLSVVGAALVSRPSFLFAGDAEAGRGRPPALGYVTALTGSLCASGVIVLIRKAGRVGAHTLQLLFSWVIFGVTFSTLAGIIASRADTTQPWRVPSQHELPSVLGVCVAGTSGHFLLNYAARRVPAATAGLLRSSDIFWAYALELVVLRQRPPPATWWGVGLVVSGLALVLWASRREHGRGVPRLESVGNLTAAK